MLFISNHLNSLFQYIICQLPPREALRDIALKGASVHQSLSFRSDFLTKTEAAGKKKKKRANTQEKKIKMSGSLRAHMEKMKSKFWVSHLCSLECPIKFANQLEAEGCEVQLLPNLQKELLLALHGSLSSNVFVF